MKKPLSFLFLLFLLSVQTHICLALSLQEQTLTVNGKTVILQVPDGMRVEFMAPLNGPRFLALGPDNELLSGSRGPNIYRLKPPYSQPETLVTLGGRIHSVAYRNGSIYAAETGGLYAARYTGTLSTLQAADFARVTPLPSATGGHWSRTVVAGPDRRLYIGLGISGNCSDEYLDNSYPFERRRGGVYVLDESSTPTLVPYSSGLRNPIGLAFHPVTEVLYAVNAGSDNMGFDLPPEVFAPLSMGSFHGMPWFQYYNGAFRSGECISSPSPRPAGEATPPTVTFDARSTPEGITFVGGSELSAEFSGNALVAIHGSWAVPSGGGSASRRPPKIVMVRFANGTAVGVTDVITGFQRLDGSRFARPCGMIMGPDGNLYFTSDDGEVTGLFRLRNAGNQTASGRTTPSVNSILLKDRNNH